MSALLDTSVLIDVLRGRPDAIALISSLREPALSSEICRVELLQGLRTEEESSAARLIALLEWIPVTEPISVLAGQLGRTWRPSYSGIGAADLIIAATAELTGSMLLTLNVKHFPMVAGLVSPY